MDDGRRNRNLQIRNLQIRNLQIRNLQIRNLQIRNLQIRNLQIRNGDKFVTKELLMFDIQIVCRFMQNLQIFYIYIRYFSFNFGLFS